MTEALLPTNARTLLNPYDLILDCTDNPATRYLLSDTAVLLGKPLISGAAQRFDGQLCTYNLGLEGPCYRCLFPKPPSPGATPTCEETGIVGAVTGVIGSLQALEAIKIIVGLHGKKPHLPVSAFGGLTNAVVVCVSVKMGHRLCWSTLRWQRRRSEASSFESGGLVALHAVMRARK